ncbi:hypothetical protein ACQCN2_00255 [Brevibacillus ginsengisoli]|uniref:hypothetical protein n=1 Tax=Brevibacillus ginsengisoli TaxID=363854 RepID=UPI003CFA202C
MTYNNFYGQNQFQSQLPVGGSASTMFQPGFAGTNANEVRQDYAQSLQTPAGTSTYAAGMYGTPVNNIFSPNFAGTNVQEVRALNSGYSSPAVHQQPFMAGMGQTMGYAPQVSSVGMPSVNEVFQPNFAGTNIQEVRARNASAGSFAGYGMHAGMSGMSAGGANSVFQPNFAGTNVQEVRALNSGYPAPSVNQQPYGQSYNMGMGMGMSAAPSFPATANAIFHPGFAGTNVHEVHQDYAQSQHYAPYNAGHIPFRSF